ncbi:MAG: hypothetical protein WCW44_00610 [archaeon]|jgi:hypothetical protein
MERNGQVAFESLFITLIVLSAGMLITNLYLQTHDDTIALSTAKTEILSQLGASNKEATIDSLKIVKNIQGDVNLNIKTTPRISLDLDLIKNKIKKATKYQSITINLE